jgi:hypothetical protein
VPSTAYRVRAGLLERHAEWRGLERGVWDCYTASVGDDLESIALGPKSVYRNVQKLKDYNIDTLWGQLIPSPGMDLRLPLPRCFPDKCANSTCLQICHELQAGESVTDVAKQYDMTANEVLESNPFLGGNSTLSPWLFWSSSSGQSPKPPCTA